MRLKSLLQIIVSLLLLMPASVKALSQDQIDVFNSGSYYYDVNGSGQSGTACGDTSLVGSDNEEKVWNYLTGPGGFNQVATAGLMGNFQSESAGTWDPRINNGGDLTDWPKSNSVAYGIVQWLGSRQDNLVKAAQDQNTIAGDLSVQLNFINSELNGAYKTTVRDPIQNLKNGDVKAQVTQAAFIVYQSYEGPNDGSYPARESNAWDIYQKFTGNQPITGGSSSGCSSSASCVAPDTQQVTTNNAAILCEAQKYAGIFYLSGGGHQGYSAFRQACPEDSIASATKSSTAADPGPCATDCSGIVSVAVDAVYNQNYNWIVDPSSGVMTGAGAENWQKLPSIQQAQPGDIVTRPDHVEIVVSVNGSQITTFGSHQTGVQTSQVDSGTDYWTVGAWRWVGPGAAQ